MVTAREGLALLLEMLSAKRLLPAAFPFDDTPGWTDGQMMLVGILLHCLGLNRAEDVEQLERDGGLCRLVRQKEKALFGPAPRWFERRFPGGRDRTFPSAPELLGWHAVNGENPAAGLPLVHARTPRSHGGAQWGGRMDQRLLEEVAAHRGVDSVTLDLGATIVSSGTPRARFVYRGAATRPPETDRRPMLAYCGELGAVVHSELRDGSVPGALDNRRFLEQALLRFPNRINEVSVRADTGAHPDDLIRSCGDPRARPKRLRRFGVIPLVCAVPRSQPLVEAVRALDEGAWRRLGPRDAGDVAEVPFEPGPPQRRNPWRVLRYLAVRRPIMGWLGLGETDLPKEPGRPRLWLRILCTNIPNPEAPAAPPPPGRGPGSTPPPLPGAVVVEWYYWKPEGEKAGRQS